MAVDFGTISEFEGGCRLEGYVPDAGGSRSGVTVATGVDLGARDEGDLRPLGLSPGLMDKLRPYLGVRGREAARLLHARPLVLSRGEARALDAAVKGSFLPGLIREYDDCLEPGMTRFDDLPAELQTVIASVAFQYGAALERRTPRFWALITSQDWEGTARELEEFGDRYPTRRRKEAALVRRCLDSGVEDGDSRRRSDNDPPAASTWGWRYHHTGIPTTERRAGERYLPELGMYVSGFPDSPYGIEWMRFEEGSPVSELVQRVPHVAFEVDDLDAALEGKEVLTPPTVPSAGVRVAMIVDDGCPIELLEFER